MKEAGVVINSTGDILYEHTPDGRSGGSLPDSHALWKFFQENAGSIAGFAHSHPGSGHPTPSWEDVTTFSAVERALGVSWDWWILTSDNAAKYAWRGPDKYTYTQRSHDGPRIWMPRLRELSEYR